MKALINYTYANNQDRFPDNINIPTDYLLYARFNGNNQDRSVNNNNLRNFGSVIPTFQIGRKNKKAIHFNGTTNDAGVITTNPVNYNSNVVSISFWIFIEKIGGIRRLFYSNQTPDGSGVSSFGVYVGVSDIVGSTNWDKLMLYYRTTSNTTNIMRFNVAPPINEWLHVVVVINKNFSPQHKLYLNNTLQPLTTVSGASDTSNFANEIPRIGVGYEGKIQNLRIYKRELTATEITNLFNE